MREFATSRGGAKNASLAAVSLAYALPRVPHAGVHALPCTKLSLLRKIAFYPI